MKKRKGIALIEVLLGAALMVILAGFISVLMLGIGKKTEWTSGAKKIEDSMDRGLIKVSGVMKSIDEIISIDDDGRGIRFTFYEEDFSESEGFIYMTSAEDGKKIIFEKNKSGVVQEKNLVVNVADFYIKSYNKNGDEETDIDNVNALSFSINYSVNSGYKVIEEEQEIFVQLRNRGN